MFLPHERPFSPAENLLQLLFGDVLSEVGHEQRGAGRVAGHRRGRAQTAVGHQRQRTDCVQVGQLQVCLPGGASGGHTGARGRGVASQSKLRGLNR